MSKIKRYAEQVSVEMGYDGELTPEVLDEAQSRLIRKADDFAWKKKCEVTNELDPLYPDKFLGKSGHYHSNNRWDGRVEIVCRHGTGHPSSVLQYREWKDIDGIHGCCGCCSHPSYKIAEEELLRLRSTT